MFQILYLYLPQYRGTQCHWGNTLYRFMCPCQFANLADKTPDHHQVAARPFRYSRRGSQQLAQDVVCQRWWVNMGHLMTLYPGLGQTDSLL